MKRQKYPTQRILLRSQEQKDFACTKIRNAPLDADKPLEVLIREFNPKRSLDQNALMWRTLTDISEQVFLETDSGWMRFSPEAWHEQFKRWYLPDESGDKFDSSEVTEGYQKWEIMPDGSRTLRGSTTKLSKRGFSIYMERLYAYGAEKGVMWGMQA